MKVLVVSNMYPDSKHPFYGTFVDKHCKQLVNLGIHCDLAVMKKKDNIVSKLFAYVIFYSLTVFKLLFSNYDVVYVHYASHSALPVLVANKVKKQCVYVNVHGSDVVPENASQEQFQKYTKKILKIADKIITPSMYFKSYVCKKYDVSSKKVYVYPSGGIDPRTFFRRSSEAICELKSKYHFNNEKKTFAYVGRISHGKGWDIFIDAVKKCAHSGIDANYIIVGNGPQYGELKKQIEKYDLVDCIYLIDLLPQEELACLYSAIDFLVFPTKREGESLGLVAIEAMACETPVIASDFAAPHYYMRDGYNGRIFEMGNSDALCKVMKECFKLGVEHTKALQRGALDTAKEYYENNILHIMREILDVKIR